MVASPSAEVWTIREPPPPPPEWHCRSQLTRAIEKLQRIEVDSAAAPEERPRTLSELLTCYGVSVAVHALLLLACLIIYAQRNVPDTPDEPIDTILVDAPVPELPAEIVIEPPAVVVEPTETLAPLGQDVQSLAGAPGAPLVTLAQVELPRGWDAGDGASDGVGPRSRSTGSLRKRNQPQSAQPGDHRVSFFGTFAGGSSFVFIVDCSGSMTDFSRPGVTRFQRAVTELVAAVSRITPRQKFSVIFYNHATYPMHFPQIEPNLVFASDETKLKTMKWFTQVKPFGGTDPREAMVQALGMKPDVIFFLTDGQIPGATRLVALQENKSQTIIHTIAIGISNHHRILKEIAADHRGRFRFVP